MTIQGCRAVSDKRLLPSWCHQLCCQPCHCSWCPRWRRQCGAFGALVDGIQRQEKSVELRKLPQRRQGSGAPFDCGRFGSKAARIALAPCWDRIPVGRPGEVVGPTRITTHNRVGGLPWLSCCRCSPQEMVFMRSLYRWRGRCHLRDCTSRCM